MLPLAIPVQLWAIWGVTMLIFLLGLGFVLLYGSSRPHL